MKIWEKIKRTFEDSSLRSRILFTLGILIIFRLLAAIPIGGVNIAALNQFLNNNQFFGILNIFSGGGLSNLSIIMLGVSPYITASIIMQLLTIMVPRLKALYHEEGEAGRRKFTQYSRLLTIPMAVVQGFGFMAILSKQGVLNEISLSGRLVDLIVIVAGSVLVMWLGELISEYGVGNGVSLIIFAGIVAGLPAQVAQMVFTFDPSQLPMYLLFGVIALLIVAGVVFMTEAERPIPVTYAKQVRGNKMFGGVSTYIPLRVNQAGVMPIIFALSILLFPQLIGNFLAGLTNPTFQHIGAVLNGFSQGSFLYAVLYFFLVVVFTYFYTAVTFEPESMATNLQKNGAFILGIRPGQPTAQYLSKVVTRITLVGAAFLGVVAILPLIIQSLSGIKSLALGGTALLIVVSVVLDLAKKIDAQLSMREY